MTTKDDTATLTDAQLWDAAESAAAALVELLKAEHRQSPQSAMPYWFDVGLVVGRLTTLTRELSHRAAQTRGD